MRDTLSALINTGLIVVVPDSSEQEIIERLGRITLLNAVQLICGMMRISRYITTLLRATEMLYERLGTFLRIINVYHNHVITYLLMKSVTGSIPASSPDLSAKITHINAELHFCRDLIQKGST